jgi:hypothetical protein
MTFIKIRRELVIALLFIGWSAAHAHHTGHNNEPNSFQPQIVQYLEEVNPNTGMRILDLEGDFKYALNFGFGCCSNEPITIGDATFFDPASYAIAYGEGVQLQFDNLFSEYSGINDYQYRNSEFYDVRNAQSNENLQKVVATTAFIDDHFWDHRQILLNVEHGVKYKLQLIFSTTHIPNKSDINFAIVMNGFKRFEGQNVEVGRVAGTELTVEMPNYHTGTVVGTQIGNFKVDEAFISPISGELNSKVTQFYVYTTEFTAERPSHYPVDELEFGLSIDFKNMSHAGGKYFGISALTLEGETGHELPPVPNNPKKVEINPNLNPINNLEHIYQYLDLTGNLVAALNFGCCFDDKAIAIQDATFNYLSNHINDDAWTFDGDPIGDAPRPEGAFYTGSLGFNQKSDIDGWDYANMDFSAIIYNPSTNIEAEKLKKVIATGRSTNVNVGRTDNEGYFAFQVEPNKKYKLQLITAATQDSVAAERVNYELIHANAVVTNNTWYERTAGEYVGKNLPNKNWIQGTYEGELDAFYVLTYEFEAVADEAFFKFYGSSHWHISAMTLESISTSNIAPVAKIKDIDLETVVNKKTTLDGSLSNDPDSSPSVLTYSWKITNQVGTIVLSSNSVTADFTPTAPGSYKIELTVSDGDLSHTALKTITVISVDEHLGNLINYIKNLNITQVTNKGNQQSLVNKLTSAKRIFATNAVVAKQYIMDHVILRVDGCSIHGNFHANGNNQQQPKDYIIDCPAQKYVYNALKKLLP